MGSNCHIAFQLSMNGI